MDRSELEKIIRERLYEIIGNEKKGRYFYG